MAERVFALRPGGDPPGQAAVERFSTADAQGIVARCLTVDPQLVVLGGGISRSAAIALGHITEERERVCIRVPRTAASALDRETVVLGAVRTALDLVDGRYFTPGRPSRSRLRRDMGPRAESEQRTGLLTRNAGRAAQGSRARREGRPATSASTPWAGNEPRSPGATPPPRR
ncbi:MULTISPECIES: hypothetical protein [unclassified Streptomyces]|uniref:hypothetical protein n=1 Tax=unclassified Streptomyces TaxID=2593676 RepID=UPI0032537430